MRIKLVAGNWKMNGNLATNQALLQTLVPALARVAGVKCAICAPFPYLAQVQQLLSGSGITWGAQNVSEFESGAYTGEVSGAMLVDFGCRYVIVGHSERRTLFGETSTVVAQKYAAALEAGLTPILCVGETLAEREAGATERVIGAQLDAALEGSGALSFAHAVIAYEPVWAIGTGKTATPDQAQAVHAYIRGRLAAQDAAVAENVQVLYGGSVKGSNAAQLFSMPDIDGGLIGGASLDANELATICQAASQAN
ncbi:MAG TPA: triose-phosphate isomerase [Burkholderiales bacterium]|jgi:triosephosphate isomerase|nr:triose-phosphate isomerase [Burkholderiales bacterium]